MTKEIVVFGSIVQDLVSYAPRFPNPGESIRGTHFSLGAGGKGANASVAAAKLGSNVIMIGRVGTDFFGDFNLTNLQNAGVSTKYIQKSPTSLTATAAITVSEGGENSIVVTLGANLELSAARAQELTETISKAGLLLCQCEISYEANFEAFKIAREHGVTTFFNPAPGQKDLDTKILDFVDIITTNENETEFLLSRSLKSLDEFKKAASEMISFGTIRLAIVTLGPRGAVVAIRKEGKSDVHHIEAPKVEAIDTTGAGDCFCGSFAHFLNADPNGNVLEMVKKAINIASVSVQRKGTQSSYPSLDELKNLNII